MMDRRDALCYTGIGSALAGHTLMVGKGLAEWGPKPEDIRSSQQAAASVRSRRNTARSL